MSRTAESCKRIDEIELAEHVALPKISHAALRVGLPVVGIFAASAAEERPAALAALPEAKERRHSQIDSAAVSTSAWRSLEANKITMIFLRCEKHTVCVQQCASLAYSPPIQSVAI